LSYLLSVARNVQTNTHAAIVCALYVALEQRSCLCKRKWWICCM